MDTVEFQIELRKALARIRDDLTRPFINRADSGQMPEQFDLMAMIREINAAADEALSCSDRPSHEVGMPGSALASFPVVEVAVPS